MDLLKQRQWEIYLQAKANYLLFQGQVLCLKFCIYLILLVFNKVYLVIRGLKKKKKNYIYTLKMNTTNSLTLFCAGKSNCLLWIATIISDKKDYFLQRKITATNLRLRDTKSCNTFSLLVILCLLRSTALFELRSALFSQMSRFKNVYQESDSIIASNQKWFIS